jgi:prenyltransferase beta subunit
LLYTLSAIQILAIADQLHKIDQEKVAEYVLGLQQVGLAGGGEGGREGGQEGVGFDSPLN